MEKEYLSSDPRKIVGGALSGWEELTEKKEDAKWWYECISRTLKELGVDLKSDGVRVLEIGTGKGLLLQQLQEQGVCAIGIDARPRHEGNLPIARARVEQLPFADGAFDVVLSDGVFDEDVYRQDQKMMIGEIARVLKDEGIYMGISENVDVANNELEKLPSEIFGIILGRKRNTA